MSGNKVVTAAMVHAAREELDPGRPGPYMMQIKKALQAALDVQPEPVTPSLRTARSEHTDDLAVDKFAQALKLRLATARNNGRANWDDKEHCSQVRLSHLLRASVESGDSVDTGNYCMFLFNRGERIK